MTEQILLKLSKADKDYLIACAKQERLSLSSYVRNRILREQDI